jgi:hypothetical protein
MAARGALAQRNGPLVFFRMIEAVRRLAGRQSPSSGSILWLPTRKRPPLAAMIGPATRRYSSQAAESVTSRSKIR